MRETPPPEARVFWLDPVKHGSAIRRRSLLIFGGMLAGSVAWQLLFQWADKGEGGIDTKASLITVALIALSLTWWALSQGSRLSKSYRLLIAGDWLGVEIRGRIRQDLRRRELHGIRELADGLELLGAGRSHIRIPNTLGEYADVRNELLGWTRVVPIEDRSALDALVRWVIVFFAGTIGLLALGVLVAVMDTLVAIVMQLVLRS